MKKIWVDKLEYKFYYDPNNVLLYTGLAIELNDDERKILVKKDPSDLPDLCLNIRYILSITTERIWFLQSIEGDSNLYTHYREALHPSYNKIMRLVSPQNKEENLK